ncbi:eukaryotic translation initiation factor 4 gamma 3-like [Bradysia coprophila]|uniref:eukaryotic translation initiation factor 4 gamma 3-like n=1 Tax=Bradysia coprophila TaxID=38358 RepID=UPI00187DC888|nr:eukaryotic translation initiation factor 4 gamma 3-like [Bradysia coprophila]
MEYVGFNESVPDEVYLQCLEGLDEILSEVIWIPSVMAPASTQEFHVMKECLAIFNKITTVDETFAKLVEQCAEVIDVESAEQAREVAAMYFEKVMGEPVFLNSYVQFTVDLANRTEVFKKAIITECQMQFERNVKNFDLNRQLQLLLQKIDEAKNSIEKDEQQYLYDEEKRKLTQNSIKIIRFIGELFNHGMLTPKIIIFCASALLDQNSEPKLECLCNLLTTVAPRLKNVKPIKHSDLDNFFKTLLEIARNQNVKISSRVRRLMLDVSDPQRNNWLRGEETRETVNPMKSPKNQRSRNRRRRNSTPDRNCNNSSARSSRKKPAYSPNVKSNHSVSLEEISNRIKHLLKNEIDVGTIQKFVTNNLASCDDADYIRAILRTTVECLMQEETLKLRGNKEAASILRTFFELLEK